MASILWQLEYNINFMKMVDGNSEKKLFLRNLDIPKHIKQGLRQDWEAATYWSFFVAYFNLRC